MAISVRNRYGLVIGRRRHARLVIPLALGEVHELIFRGQLGWQFGEGRRRDQHAENPLVQTLGEEEFGHAPFRCRPVGRDEEDDQLAALRRALQLGLPFLTGLQPAFGIEVEVKPRTRTIEAPPAGSIRKKDRGKPSPVPSLSSVALALALWPEHGKILKKLMRELIDPQLATRLQACS